LRDECKRLLCGVNKVADRNPMYSSLWTLGNRMVACTVFISQTIIKIHKGTPKF